MSLVALLYKNWLLLRRAPCGFIVTFLFCTAIIGVVLLLAILTDPPSVPRPVVPTEVRLRLTTMLNAPNYGTSWTDQELDRNSFYEAAYWYLFPRSPQSGWNITFEDADPMPAFRLLLPPLSRAGESNGVERATARALLRQTYASTMGLSLDMLADMQAAAANDSDYARLFDLNYGEVSTDEELESSCKNLQMRRFTAITTMHDRLSEDQPAGFPNTEHLFPVLLPIVRRVVVDQPPGNISGKVMLALKIELGLLNDKGRPPTGLIRRPMFQQFSCIAPVLELLNVNARRVRYRMRSEYDSYLEPDQPPVVVQDHYDTTSCPCGSKRFMSNGLVGCPTDAYKSNQFLKTQVALDKELIRLLTNNSDYEYPVLSGARCLGEPREILFMMLFVQAIVGLIMLAFVPMPGAIAARLCAEKESRMKQLLLVLGMSPHAFWFSWFAIYFVMMVVISILLVVATHGSIMTSWLATFTFLLSNLLHSVCTFAYGFIISAVFETTTKANRVAHIGSLLLLGVYFVTGYLREGIIYAVHPAAMYAIFLLEPALYGNVVQKLIVAAQLQGNDIFTEPHPNQPTLIGMLVMLAADAVLYCAVALLLEFVLSEEYGEIPIFGSLRKMGRNRVGPCHCKEGSSNEGSGEQDDLKKQQQRSGRAGAEAEAAVEPVPSSSREALVVRDLWKVFPAETRGGKPVRAVRGLDLTVYEGEITCLLGPNGAGKSTFLSMLMGLARPTDGSIHVFGQDMGNHSERQVARQSMGFCLQQNVCYDSLTAIDHLNFIASLRGIPWRERSAQIEALLEEFDLFGSRYQRVEVLSGGQKRRLSICMALLGEPRFCVLDEPTTGVDPVARRQIWAALQRRRENRVILFTTHFMDEADLLADRKAIITMGQLRCAGRSLFLKTRFGLGYTLTMDLESGGNRQETKIIEIIKQFIPNALWQVTPNQLLFTLPLSETDKFHSLFECLDADVSGMRGVSLAASCGVKAYGVAMTTLEQVFLRLVEETQENGDSSGIDAASTSDAEAEASAPGANPAVASDVTDSASALKNPPQSATNEAFTADGGAGVYEEMGAKTAPRVHLNGNGVAANGGTPKQKNSADVVRELAEVLQNQEQVLPGFFSKLLVLFRVFAYSSYRNLAVVIAKLIILLIFFIPFAAFIIYSLVSSYYNPETTTFSPQTYLTPATGIPESDNENAESREQLYSPLWNSLNLASPHWLNTSALNASVGPPKWAHPLWPTQDTVDPVSYLRESICRRVRPKTNLAVSLPVPRSNIRLGHVGWRPSIEELGAEELVVGYAATARHSLPIAVNLVSNALLRSLTNTSALPPEAAPQIEMLSQQLPFNSRSMLREQLINSGMASMLALPLILIAAIGAMLFLAFAGSEIASDRECGVLQLLRLSGVRGFDYWFSRFCFDLPHYLLIMLVFYGFLIQPIAPLQALQPLPARILLLCSILLSAPQLLLFVYTTSFLFKQAGSALLFYLMIFTLVPAVLYVGIWLVDMVIAIAEVAELLGAVVEFEWEPFYQVARYAAIFFVPPYSLIACGAAIEGNFTMVMKRMFSVTLNLEDDEPTFGDYIHGIRNIRESNLLWPIMAMCIQIVVMSVLLFILHERTYFPYRSLLPSCLRQRLNRVPRMRAAGKKVEDSSNGQNLPMSAVPDAEIAAEKAAVDLAVQNLPKDYGYPVMLHEARREFAVGGCCGLACGCAKKCGCCGCTPRQTRVALRSVSLAVRQNELLGLLGPNGAGKTTTMKLVVGDEAPTSGTVYVRGVPLGEQGAEELCRVLNYCPQMDTLWPRLTMSEVLHVFARLRGLSPRFTKRLLAVALHALRLEKFVNRRFEALSGGTKRKVLFVMSVMGNSQMVLFDEPTSGLDPESRRLLWNVMLALFQQAAPDGSAAVSDGARTSTPVWRADATPRSCVLTTHSLEEAEALCSRIAILLRGQIYALGSIQQLKEKLGAGFTLELYLSSDDPNNVLRVQGFVGGLFPQAESLQSFSNYLCFRVPRNAVRSLGAVFRELEMARSSLGISEYSFSQVTLEQMFIELVRMSESDEP